MIHPDYLKAVKLVADTYPNEYAISYPRRIIPPNHTYANPKIYAATTTALLADLQTTKRRDIRGMDVVALSLVQEMVPTYFISPKILEAISHTDLPADFSFRNLKWPREALLFCLPWEESQKLFGRPVPWMAVAHLQEGKLYGSNVTNDNERIAIHMSTFHKDQIYPLDYGNMIGVDRTLADMVAGNTINLDPVSPHPWLAGKLPPSDSEEERILTEKMINTLLLILLAMVARPDLIEKGEIVRKEKKHSNPAKAQDALWSANVFGRVYAPKTESNGEKPGISPRMHWRRGHMRNQIKGRRFDDGGNKIPAQLREHFSIWIEPVMVNRE